MRKYVLWLTVLLFVLSGSLAFAQANFTNMVTFGDSLTHNDILGIVYGNPQDMYGKDAMEAVFSKGASGGDKLTNYAVAGSESSQVAIQIDLYEFFQLIGFQKNATLIGFEIGGNDILNNTDLLVGYAPGQNPSADEVIDRLIANARKDLLRLRRSHQSAQFIIWTIPDVTLTPRLWYGLTPWEIANLREHIERANHLIRNLRKYPFVVVLDLYRLMPAVIENPPVFFGQQLVAPPDYGNYDHLFADEIHPTAVSNALLANIMIQIINSKWNDSVPLYTEEELADLARIP